MLSRSTLLVAGICVYIANPLFAAVAPPRPVSTIHSSLTESPDQPTCIEPGVKLTSSNNNLGDFASDCVAAANDFFNIGIISRTTWNFKRNPPGQIPPVGYLPLPFFTAPLGCAIRLDILSDPDAEDRFALVELAADFRRLMDECIRPHPSLPASGFVPVGPRKVLKLSVSPTPESVLLEAGSILNGTGLLNVAS